MRYIYIFFFTINLLTLNLSAQKKSNNDNNNNNNNNHKRPNILFILADDQSPFDLKLYNKSSILETPVLDKLASEGMVIDGAYHMGAWSAGVCTPSRHMIMSGRTVWHIPDKPQYENKRNPYVGNINLVPADLPEHTLAEIFNRSGYKTMRTCKANNSYTAANEKFMVNHEKICREADDENGSAWHAQQVLNYLNDRDVNNEKDPFLIYLGFSHPHDTRNGKVDLLAKYGSVNHTDINSLPPANPKQPSLPQGYLESHPFSIGGSRDENKVSGVWKNRDEQTIRNELGREFACSENIDIQIGQVLQKLDEMGELDNTYIIYTADHGIAIGRHGLQGKQNLYEHTLRVPFIVKGPGIKAGSRAQGNIYLLDVLGTLCDLASIEAPKTTESISFKSVLEGQQTTVRDVIYGVYSKNNGTTPGIRSVRKGDWKLIKYDRLDGKVRETQLFNLKENPHELLKEHHAIALTSLTGVTPSPAQVNLAGDPSYAEKLKEMEDLLLAEMRNHDDPYRLWNQPDEGLIRKGAKSKSKKKSKK